MSIRTIYNRIRFGKIEYRIKDRVGGVDAEIEAVDRSGRVVGYWAYGYWCPNMPYKETNRVFNE